MIVGIGVDILEKDRIIKAVEKESFLIKTFTNNEIKISDMKAETLGGFFCTKEAVSKCLGTGIRGFELKDIEVYKDESGKPYVRLYNNALKISEGLNIKNIHISISHSKDNIIAFAIAEK